MMKDLAVLQEKTFSDIGSVSEVFDDIRVFMDLRAMIERINTNAVAASFDSTYFSILIMIHTLFVFILLKTLLNWPSHGRLQPQFCYQRLFRGIAQGILQGVRHTGNTSRSCLHSAAPT